MTNLSNPPVALPEAAAAPRTPGSLQLHIDHGLTRYLHDSASSLALTVGQGGLLLVGARDAKTPFVEHCLIPNAFALAYGNGQLAVSHKRGITVYRNAPAMAPRHPGRPGVLDAYFAPQLTFHTGDCLVHDIAMAPEGLVVANTRFSTVCLIDGRHHINPIWYPGFISAPAPEDRCHLNGLAISGKALRYATAFGPYDTPGGWRGVERFRGLLIDVAAQRTLAQDLSMPHSPRLHQERLFVCESGEGAVHEVDRQSGALRTVARLPGLTRGLAFDGDTMLVGLSTKRASASLPPLPIIERGTALVAGVAAVDLNSGRLAGKLQILDPGREVLDLKLLPGIRCAAIEDADDLAGMHLVESVHGGHWIQAAGQPVET